ncbi:MAG: SHOCT domain-containing protein [Alphaproteobacteria bacterium]|nr:SHOCT domain-containing protein [Alphaproteobacteria bacterium]
MEDFFMALWFITDVAILVFVIIVFCKVISIKSGKVVEKKVSSGLNSKGDYRDLERLHDLYKRKLISKEEYEEMKQVFLND